MLKTSLLTNSSTSVTRITVKYDKVGGNSDKLVKKLSKSQKIVKSQKTSKAKKVIKIIGLEKHLSKYQSSISF